MLSVTCDTNTGVVTCVLGTKNAWSIHAAQADRRLGQANKLAVGGTPRQMGATQAGLSNKMKRKIATNGRPTYWPRPVPESESDV